ncbi:tol-pal system protein YbgF [Vibrio azureus]|uniref:Cell division coordinator CpoB n=1 Tax=Vibrio azureus NBRC 104587 TaxID=1219077 RepID=U3ARL6_9VIBR|nr:tol-pal system protein YbgF [Vibrio azureus]AUI85821.1 tol-pal system protein YbgF [Vibrio azureus]GAD76395.1 putative TolA-binding protein [Vibrio azureus NBRC 104587]
MFSSSIRIITLALLASAANNAFAAPAPVSDLTRSSSYTRSSSESDVERLERLLQNRNRVQLQMQTQIDQMAQEISELRGQAERNNYEIQQMLKRQRELFVELDQVRGGLKSAPAQEPKSVSGVSEGQFSSNADEQATYRNAVDLILKKKDYAGAVAAFEQFQKDYPNSTYTANSHYWLGQLYFAKKQDKEAAKRFISVMSYKDSSKRPDALLKLGDIAARNNNATQAKKYYQQVVDEYPDSASAKIAKSKL